MDENKYPNYELNYRSCDSYWSSSDSKLRHPI